MAETEFEPKTITEIEAKTVTEIEARRITEIEDAEKVTHIEAQNPSKQYTTSFKVESYLNTFIHILNGIAASCLTIYLIQEVQRGWPSTNDTFPLHAFLSGVGYQLFMAEAILVYYAPNSWSYSLSYKTKRHLHWILHVLGAIFIISGNILISVIRTTPHFKDHHREPSIHSITGLISMILLVITMLQGVWSYFAYDLRSYLKPSTSRFLHNIVSVLCFVLGMISLAFGYPYGIDHGAFGTIEVQWSLTVIAIVTTIFTLIAALIASKEHRVTAYYLREIKKVQNFCKINLNLNVDQTTSTSLLTILYDTEHIVDHLVNSTIHITRCRHGDSNCLSKLITQLIQSFPNGISSLDIGPLDPIPMADSIRNFTRPTINLYSTNVKLTGLQQGVINDVVGFGEDPKNSNFEIHATFPLLTVLGDYDLTVFMMFGKISGKGHFKYSYYDNKVSFKFICSTEVRNGEEYLLIQKIICESIISKMTIHLHNSTLDSIATALKFSLFPQIKKYATDILAETLLPTIQRVFNKFPYKDVFIN